MPLRYGDFYPALIADFLVAHSCMQELGGYPGCDGEYDGEVVWVDSRFLVYVSARVCEWPEPSGRDPFRSSLWFLVLDEVKGTRSFAVETESMIGALENFAPSLSRLDRPPRASMRAVDVHGLDDDDHVVAGSTLYLALMPVQVKAPGDTDEPRLPTDGIRFEIGDGPLETSSPAYSFTLEGLVPFMALSAALQDPGGDRPPKSFSEELDELAAEIEAATEEPPLDEEDR